MWWRLPMPKRDQKRMDAGKATVAEIAAIRSDPGLLGMEDLADAIYYLDGTLFLPTGTRKAAQMVRKEARKRGLV